jgi:hypothetical protein
MKTGQSSSINIMLLFLLLLIACWLFSFDSCNTPSSVLFRMLSLRTLFIFYVPILPSVLLFLIRLYLPADRSSAKSIPISFNFLFILA